MLAKTLYAWVATAKRPLSLGELQEAVSIEPCQPSFRRDRLVHNPYSLIQWCGNLVALDEDEELVRFAHHSIKEFLIEEKWISLAGDFHLSLAEADTTAGEICVTYLNFSDFERQLTRPTAPHAQIGSRQVLKASVAALENSAISKMCSQLEHILLRTSAKDLDIQGQLSALRKSTDMDSHEQIRNQYLFLEYAGEHWLSHTSTFSDSQQSWQLWKKLAFGAQNFAKKPWSEDDWLRKDDKIWQWAAEYSHYALLRFMLRPESEFAGQSGLKYIAKFAVREQHYGLIQKLCSYQSLPELTLGSMLTEAAKEGHLDLVHIILRSRLNASLPRDTDPYGFGEAIFEAILRGHRDVLVGLLEASFVCEEMLSHGNKPPHEMTSARTQIVDVLMGSRSASHPGDHSPLDKSQALVTAVSHGYEDIVQRLLEAENVRRPRPLSSSLSLKSCRSYYDVFGSLLRSAAYYQESITPDAIQESLETAARNGHLHVIRRLLEHRRQIPLRCMIPLLSAVEAGHLDTVKYFIAERGMSGYHPLETYNEATPLHFAARAKSVDILSFLLDTANTIRVQNLDGSTILHEAVRAENPVFVGLILAKDSSSNFRGCRSYNADLDGAAPTWYKSAQRDPTTNGYTALELAAQAGFTDIVHTILDHSDEIWVDLAAIRATVRTGRRKTLGSLLYARKDSYARFEQRRVAALAEARMVGDETLVKVLGSASTSDFLEPKAYWFNP